LYEDQNKTDVAHDAAELALSRSGSGRGLDVRVNTGERTVSSAASLSRNVVARDAGTGMNGPVGNQNQGLRPFENQKNRP
jgi:hypothetical protein